MPTFQINSGHISRPRQVGAGQVVTVRPAAGATAIVEYTTGSGVDVGNLAATWRSWPKGNVTTATSDKMSNGGYIRVTALNGNVSYDINENPSSAVLMGYRNDWDSSMGSSAPVISGQPVVGGTLTATLPPGVLGTLQFTRQLRASPFTKTNISGAVASAVNSLNYTVQQSDTAYLIGCDASAQVSPAAGVEINVVPTAAPPIPDATLRQAASGTFPAETLNSTMFHFGNRLPYTAGIDIPAGSTIRTSYANKAVLSNVETNGTGTLTLLAASMEYAGAVTAAALTQPTAVGGAIAYHEVVVPTAIPKGAIFWLSVKGSDGGGVKQFPWYSHSSTNVSKQVIAGTSAGVPDQTMVVGGGSWTTVTGGAQSIAIVPIAVEVIHSGKVASVGGSSSGVGRADPLAPGAGVQGYIQRALAGLGYPVKCVAVSGDRVVALAASDAFRISQLQGVSHHVIVVGGNDITDGTTAANMLAAYQTHINHIRAAWPSIKIMVLTLTPVVTGTYDTLGGQTVHSTNAVRIAANTQILANVLTGVDKVGNINLLGENIPSPEDGKFPVSQGQMTNDGLHYNSVGCGILAASPIFAEFMAL